MVAKNFSKQSILDLIRNSPVLNIIIVVDEDLKVELKLRKTFWKQGEDKYNFIVYKNWNKEFENKSKANYWYSVDEIFEFLQDKSYIKRDPLSGLFWGSDFDKLIENSSRKLKEWINLVTIQDPSLENKKDKIENPVKKQFDKSSFLNNIGNLDKQKKEIEMIRDLVSYDFSINTDYLNISKTPTGVQIVSSDNKVFKEYKEEKNNIFIMKEYLYQYLLNIPNRYNKEELLKLNKDIFIRYLIGKKMNQLTIKIISSEWEEEDSELEENRIIKDFSLIYVLCSLKDLMIDKKSLKLWLEDVFKDNKITTIENIQF